MQEQLLAILREQHGYSDSVIICPAKGKKTLNEESGLPEVEVPVLGNSSDSVKTEELQLHKCVCTIALIPESIPIIDPSIHAAVCLISKCLFQMP